MQNEELTVRRPENVAQNSADEVRRITVWGLFINLGLCSVKFIVGVTAASQALVADAVHSLSDSITDIAVLVGVKFWSAPADKEHPHGHGRIETMISSFIGFALAAVGIGLAWRAIVTLREYHVRNPGWPAFFVACISIVVKESLYQWTVRVGKRIKSSAMVANAWHHRSDAFSSVPVAIAVLAVHLWSGIGFLDHFAAMLVSILIIQAAWQITAPALNQLIDTGADEDSREEILAIALNTDGVKSVHALRTRHIGPGLGVDLHVLVDPNLNIRDGHIIAGRVKERLLTLGPDVIDVLVHIEPFEPPESDKPIE
jgi:cation diffusion facilitator family transporter